jgi:hypothetical protein
LAGLVSAILVVAGTLPWTAHTAVLVRVLAIAVFAAGVLIGLVAWGLHHSIALDRRHAAEAEFDAALIEAAGPAGACGCGHAHDPEELHIVDACEHDGDGERCERNCESCVLATLRR